MEKKHSIPAFHILANLNKEQIRAFERFIGSPYHVTHEGVELLFKLYKNSPNKIPEKADIEKILSQKGQKTDRRFYDYSNYLMEALENFLAQELIQQDEIALHIKTTTFLRKLKLREEADAMLRYTARKVEKIQVRSAEDIRNHFLLQSEAYLLSLQQGRSKSFNIMELADAQDVSFLCEKLRTGCLLLSHEALTQQVYDKSLLLKMLDFLDGHRFLEIPLLAVYYHGYYAQADDTNGEFHFKALKQLLEEKGKFFAQSELHDLYLMAINFCIRRLNRREMHYLREVFDLYKSGLLQGALLEDQNLSRWTYGNITVTALRLQEYDWLYNFLHEYAPLVPQSHREGALNHGLARYYYETGQHREAMSALMRTEYDDVLQNLVAKILLAKIYYETNEFDSLENHLDSIQIYIRRKKVLGYHKENYSNTIRYIRKMIALQSGNKKAIISFRQEIENEAILTEKPWFIKMLSIL